MCIADDSIDIDIVLILLFIRVLKLHFAMKIEQ